MIETASRAHDRIRSARYLAEGLDEIVDPVAIAFFRSFVDRLSEAYDRDGLPVPVRVGELRTASDRIAQTSSPAIRLRVLNRALRHFFVKTTLFDESAPHLRTQVLGSSGDEARASRDPLPMRHAAVVLQPDPRAPEQFSRAASLAVAALRVHARPFPFPRTIVAGANADRFVEPDEETRILVLARGVAYSVWLGRNAAGFDASDLADIFQSADADALAFTAHGDAWLEPVPAFVTAASRATAWRLRRMLERDPENARGLGIIDRCLFAVCLDAESIDGSQERERAATERLAGRMLANVANRWYGMTNIVVDAAGQAALVGPYANGEERTSLVVCASTIFEHSLAVETCAAESRNRRARWKGRAHVERIAFREPLVSELTEKAAEEIASCFHSHRSLYDLDLGTTFFRSVDAPPSATLQYALALAVRDVWDIVLLPAVVQCVHVRDTNGEVGGIDWVSVSTTGSGALVRAAKSPHANLLQPIVQAGRNHAARVASAQAGNAPTRFLREPSGRIDAIVYEFFSEVGRHFASGYRSQLFDVHGGASAADIVSHLVRSPANVRFGGRAGTRTTDAGMFAVDIELRADRTRLCFMPGTNAAGRLEDVYRSLDVLASRLRADARG